MSVLIELFGRKIEFNTVSEMQNWLDEQRNAAKKVNEILAQRWSNNAEGWEVFIRDKKSYVNFEDGYQRFDNLLLDNIPQNISSVLEIGCGTGHVSRLISDANNDSSIDAIDIAPGMIKKAIEITSQKNIQFIEANIFDIEKLGYKYDLICSRGVIISHMPLIEVADFFCSVVKVLNDDGMFIFDFIQNLNAGDVEKPTLNKNDFSLKSIDGIMNKLGLKRTSINGNADSRVLSVCYQKTRGE